MLWPEHAPMGLHSLSKNEIDEIDVKMSGSETRLPEAQLLDVVRF
jgi:hypothetical protein